MTYREAMSTVRSTAERLIGDRLVKFGLQRPLAVRDLTARDKAPDRLSGKKVLVTGASSGIGEAAAIKLADLGGELVLIARNAENLQAVVDRITADGGRAHAVTGDLSSEDDITRLLGVISAEHGTPDVVVNNAGRSIRRGVLDSTDRLHDFQRTMALNYFGPVQLTLGLLPAMVAAGSGHFVNVSTWGVPAGSMPKFSAYAASKAAISAFGRSIATELSGTGVDVTTVYFPLIRTPMIAPTADYDALPALSSDEAADWIVYAIDHRPVDVMPRYARLLRGIGAADSGWADALTGRTAI